MKFVFSKNILLLVIVITITFQIIITYLFTKTQRFSIRATLRNLSFTIAIYYAIKTKNYFLLLIPLFLECIVEYIKYNGYDMDPYVATEYQYSDFWIDRSRKNPIISNFSEANYDGILGFDTTDNSSENNKKIYEWCKKTYLESLKKQKTVLHDANDNIVPEPKILKKIADDRKFKLISQKCNIKPGMRILEIGFGDGDFMDYIHKHYNIRPVGVSISNEQVKFVKDRGFEAYHMNSWDMTPEKIGTFDIIIQCGNLEYILRCGQNEDETYTKYSMIIKKLLKDNGRYFITCCHTNDDFYKHIKSIDGVSYLQVLDFYLHIYFLWSGNDGLYPNDKNNFSKNANKIGLKTIYREERTHDYFINMILFFSYFQTYNNNLVTTFTLSSLSDALLKTIAAPYYIHTYLCYLSTNNYIWCPFTWEFSPQNINGKWKQPVTLQYIMFEK